jgi:hypothetical protein
MSDSSYDSSLMFGASDGSDPSSDVPALSSIVRGAFHEIHGFTPKDWQLEVAIHILECALEPAPLTPQSLLLVKSTGGGKSAVRDAVGLALAGVTLSLSPLLSLAADQATKLAPFEKDNDNVHVYNIDNIRNATTTKKIQEEIIALAEDTESIIFLFASPQKLNDKTGWKETIKVLAENNLLRFVAVDECHLYANFGIEFRSEFYHLRTNLFEPLSLSCWNIPILFMTATGTQSMVDDLQSLTSLTFDSELDVFWTSNPVTTQRRNIDIKSFFQNTPLPKLKTTIGMIVRSNKKEKIILYTNSLSKAKRFVDSVESFLNEKEFALDVLTVNGDLYREQKFHNTEVFVGDSIIFETGGETFEYNPQLLVATSGAANAGIDSKLVRFVIRDGFPPTLQDLIQEMGRCARWENATSMTDSFMLVISTNSFFSLLFRIYIVPILEKEKREQSSTGGDTALPSSPMISTIIETENNSFLRSVTIDEASLQARQFKNVIEVLRVVCLHPGRCIHMKLEYFQLNPFRSQDTASSTQQPTFEQSMSCVLPCGNACWQCNISEHMLSLNKPIRLIGLRVALIDLMIHRSPRVDKLLLTPTGIVKTMTSYINSDGKAFVELVFGPRSKSQADPLCRALVLRLFASSIFIAAIDDKRLYAKLAIDATGTPLVNQDQYFTDGFKFI